MNTFHQAAMNYQAHAQNFRDASMALADAKAAVSEAAALVTARESELLLDGAALGKNAEERKAALIVACNEDEVYRGALAGLRRAQIGQSEAETNRDDAANGMSLARREMDHAIATIELTAATEAGRGYRKED